jgi:hypothetical protein
MDKITSGATTIAVLGSPDRDSADSLLLQHGAVLFRGLGVDSPAEFHEFVRTFGEPFTNYRHGNSPRVAVQAGVWTSTEYPAEYEISLHNELSYSHRWPSRLFFYCDQAPATGGATPVSDSRAVLDGLSPEVRGSPLVGSPTCRTCMAGSGSVSPGRTPTRPATGVRSSAPSPRPAPSSDGRTTMTCACGRFGRLFVSTR